MLKILHGIKALEWIMKKTNIIVQVFLNIKYTKENGTTIYISDSYPIQLILMETRDHTSATE